MQVTSKNPSIHLLTVRVWSEVSPNGKEEWRGSVRYGLNGTTQYFNGWAALIDVVKELTEKPQVDLKSSYDDA